MIYNPDNPAATMYGGALEAAAPPLGIEPTIAHVHGVGDIERAAAAAAVRSNGGVFVAPDVTLYALTRQTVAINAQHRLPAIYSDRSAARLGGLVYTAPTALSFSVAPRRTSTASCAGKSPAIRHTSSRRSTSSSLT